MIQQRGKNMDTKQKLQQLEMIGQFSIMLKQTFEVMNELCQKQLGKNKNQNEKGGKDQNKKIHKAVKGQQKKIQSQHVRADGKKKKQAKWQLQGKPRPPLNAFMLFLRDSKFQIQQARPQLTSSAVSTYASTIWNDLPQEQKQKYRSQYRENRSKYQEQLEQYRLTEPIKEVKKKSAKKKKSKKKKAEHEQPVAFVVDASHSQNQQSNSLQI